MSKVLSKKVLVAGVLGTVVGFGSLAASGSAYAIYDPENPVEAEEGEARILMIESQPLAEETSTSEGSNGEGEELIVPLQADATASDNVSSEISETGIVGQDEMLRTTTVENEEVQPLTQEVEAEEEEESKTHPLKYVLFGIVALFFGFVIGKNMKKK